MKEKIKILIAVGIIMIFIFTGYLLWKGSQERTFCKDQCRYNPSVPVWVFDEEGNHKYFSKLEQCTDYCLRHK